MDRVGSVFHPNTEKPAQAAAIEVDFNHDTSVPSLFPFHQQFHMDFGLIRDFKYVWRPARPEIEL